jgi:hypothetical protein
MKASALRFDGVRYIRENFSLERMAERTVKVYASLKRNEK